MLRHRLGIEISLDRLNLPVARADEVGAHGLDRFAGWWKTHHRAKIRPSHDPLGGHRIGTRCTCTGDFKRQIRKRGPQPVHVADERVPAQTAPPSRVAVRAVAGECGQDCRSVAAVPRIEVDASDEKRVHENLLALIDRGVDYPKAGSHT